jgi:hypothetical protein
MRAPRCRAVLLLALLPALGCVGAVVGDESIVPERDDALAREERAAYQAARPVFAARCGRCHDQAGGQAAANKLARFDMTEYPFGGRHGDDTQTIRRVLGLAGVDAIMPFDEPGALDSEELALISAWADACDRARAGGAHP